MPRRPYGNTAASVVTDPTTGRPARRARLPVWFSETGGEQVTDLCDLAGRPLPHGVVTADDRGRLAFLGPPDFDRPLWAGDDETRLMVVPSDLHHRTAGAAVTAAASTTESGRLVDRIGSLAGSRGAPSGIATLAPGGALTPNQMPPLPPGVLDGLADVDVAAPMPGQALVYDGDRWVPGRVTPLAVSLGAGGTALINTTGAQFPEFSLAEAAWSAEAGFPVEVTVMLTADGALVADPLYGLYSSTTDLGGELSDVYRNAVARRVSTPGIWFEPGYPNLPLVTVEEILDQCAGRVPVIVRCSFRDEFDDNGLTRQAYEQGLRTVARIAQVIHARNLVDSVLVWPTVSKTTGSINEEVTLAVLQAVIDAGLRGIYGSVRADWVDPTLLTRIGVEWVSLFYWASETTADELAEQVRALNAAGLKVILAWISTHEERDRVLLAKPQAILTDQPLYLSGPERYRRKTDPFASQTRAPGLIPDDASNARGKFQLPNWWSPGYSGGGTLTYLQGWGCPMDVNPTSWSMLFDIRWDAVFNDEFRRMQVVFCCPTDSRWFSSESDVYSGDKGYVAELRFNGGISIARFNGDAIKTNIRTPVLNTPAPTAGQIITYRIDVTPTSLTLIRQGTGGGQVTMNDTVFRGRYFHIGTRFWDSSTAVSIRNVSYF